jgi:hypothetical protein
MAMLRVSLRLSAVSFAVTGVLLIAVTLVHPSIFDRPISDVVLESAAWWVPAHLAGLVVFVLTVFGAAGIVAAHGDHMGRLGHAGLVVTLVGAGCTGALAAVEAVVFPVLAERAPDLLRLDGPLVASWPLAVVGVAALGWFLGLAMIGAAAARCSVFPRAAGVLLAVSSVLFLAFEGPFVPVLGLLAGVLFGAVQIWWGWLLGKADDGPSQMPSR